jgi:ABC-type antimicrobial peptide transport system permease subunit
MVLRQSLLLAGSGILVGGLIAAVAASGLRNMLFGLPPVDPLAFTGSAALLLAVALLASLGPARRAARVDPMVALRAE